MGAQRSGIFSRFTIGSCVLNNRLVALPVYTGFAYPDGSVSPPMLAHYRRLAASGVAMVVVANVAVSPDGVTSSYTLRIDRDDYIPGLAQLAQTIQQQGALACLQLNHAGRFAKTDRPLLPSPVDSENLAFNLSALKDFMQFFPLERRFILTRYFLKQAASWRRAMTPQDRDRIVAAFGDAAQRACRAGFDMVELHGAMGYLLCQFLSPTTHKGQADVDGDFQRRITFPLAVVREVKRRLPQDFPVGFRLITREWVPGGIDLPESLALAKILEQERIAYLSAAAATYNSIFLPHVLKHMARPGYLRDDTAKLTGQVRIPTIISGRIITPSLAEELIRAKVADLIGLGRTLRADVGWVSKALAGGQGIKRCLNCHWCLKRVILEQGFNCRRWPKLVQQRTDLDQKMLARSSKPLWVLQSRADLELFQASRALLFAGNAENDPMPPPTVLFLSCEHPAGLSGDERQGFLEWTRAQRRRLGFKDAAPTSIFNPDPDFAQDVVQDEIRSGHYGVVVLARKSDQPWRERLVYHERQKVIGLLGTEGDRRQMLVPVDLSDTTLLVLRFLRRNYCTAPHFRVEVAHVLTGPANTAERRWKELLRISGFEAKLSIRLIPSQGDVAEDIINLVRTGAYGVVVMGKRGLSGIKRWLVGSVSAAVLRGLPQHSLFLVD